MRRTLRRALLGLVLLVVFALAGGLIYARPLLKTGTGYAAHNACAVRLLAGRDAEAPATDLPDNPLVPYLRTSVDSQTGTARSSILGVLYGQTAYYTKGYGCTLGSRPQLPKLDETRTSDTWGGGNDPVPPANDKIAQALDAAFGADAATQARLGTRAVVVVHGDKIVAERYATGFTPSTRQLGWSMGKSVTNLMTGMLEKQGKIARSEVGLRPEWTDDRRAISLTHLLQMTSGLGWDETYDLGTPITRMLYLQDDMGGYAASLKAKYPTGTHQQYSSGTTNIICQLLQQRSGLGADLANQLVFDKLGMTSAVLEPDATGHPVCSSYLWATPRDWALIGQFALQNGEWDGEQLLPEDWMTFSTTPVAVETEDEGHAAHWWINRKPDGTLRFPAMPADTYWASGHDGQRVVVVPSADLVVVRMGFTPAEVDTGFDRLVGAVVTATKE